MDYTPNKIVLSERVACALLSAFLIVYGGYGLYKNDLYIPARRGGVHFSNEPAWLMYGAFVCGCIVMISVIVDHYDERNNERGYRIFRNVFKYIGFGLSCFVELGKSNRVMHITSNLRGIHNARHFCFYFKCSVFGAVC